ncbi:MAG TPA: hypothetical protein VI636_03010 [Candidatus Angelobacter sp.]
MKKVLLTVVLALITAGVAQQTQPGQPATPQSQKVIKDPAEYNAYVTALNTTDPAAKAAAMEAFVKQYPQSVVFTDALEQAMAAYQQLGNTAKVVEKAKQILALNANNIRALAIVTAIDRNIATQGGAAAGAALKEMCSMSQTGIQQLPGWPKPEGMSDADFEKLRTQMADIFNGAAGFCALQNKDNAGARTYYEKAFQLDPTNLQDVYQLSVSLLEMNPMDTNGLWYCSKAIQLAQSQNLAQAVQGMVGYCKAKYKKYHGGEDGWDELVAGTSTETKLPADFPTRIKPAPTPCDLAVQAVQQNDPATLSFGDKEFILSKAGCSPANKDAADKVWKSIQDMEKNGEARLEISIKIISATTDSIEAAISDDNQQVNKADMHIILEKPAKPPVRPVKPPAPGTMTKIVGVITNYTPDPFMFTMEKAALPAAKAPPVRHPARKKK